MKIALLRPAVSRPVLAPAPAPVAARPIIRPAVPRFALVLSSRDALDASQAYLATQPPATVDDAITHCLKALGHSWMTLGGRDYALRMKLPGAIMTPDAALTNWIKAEWGNYYWLADFAFQLLHARPQHLLQQVSICLHSSPPLLKGSVTPDWTNAPF